MEGSRLGRSGTLARILLGTLGLTLIAAFALAAYWSLRLAYADHLASQDSPDSRARALRLAPANALYHARSRSASALEEAVRLNPYHSAAWIDLGLRAELQGRTDQAERYLLEAAKVDKTYQPRWTLANFYFRQNEPNQFWQWARAAAETAYHDQTALFDLCWRVSQDPALILDRAIPDRPRILAGYLSFLVTRNRLSAADEVARRLVPRIDPGGLPVILGYCDRLLQARQVLPAVEVWNALSGRALIPHPKLAPEQGLSLTNPNFAVEPLLGGFDWRIHSTKGVSTTRTISPAGVRVAFSGKQPESCRLIEQFVPLVPSRRYLLHIRYRTSEIEPGSGLRWQITDAPITRELAATQDLCQQDWTEEKLAFSTPPDLDLARVALIYRRRPGTVRIEGTLWLEKVSLGFEE